MGETIMSEAFTLGARGECVSNLQRALRIKSDGRFGPNTYDAVSGVERELGRAPQGKADPLVFSRLGLAWPDEFERVLALVIELEGTSYGDCNATDIDGAGLTMGICGFTTRYGEVQALLETFLNRVPEEWRTLSRPMRERLRDLTAQSAAPRHWERVVLDEHRRPIREIQSALAAWGQHPVMRELQRTWARERFWQSAVATAHRLGVDTPAGRAMLFDIAVQNGGWARRHERRLARLAGGDALPEHPRERLRLIAIAVAAEAKAPWRGDVLSRKMLFAQGAGMVHGTFFSLAAQAIIVP